MDYDEESVSYYIRIGMLQYFNITFKKILNGPQTIKKKKQKLFLINIEVAYTTIVSDY